jgi:Zn-dependent protease with chaperone function
MGEGGNFFNRMVGFLILFFIAKAFSGDLTMAMSVAVSWFVFVSIATMITMRGVRAAGSSVDKKTLPDWLRGKLGKASLFVFPSSTPNAFYSFGNIGVSQGLLKYFPGLCVFIIAHEIGHMVKKHVPVMVAAQSIINGAVVYFGPEIGSYIFFSKELVLMYLSRRNEYEADAYALSLCRDNGVAFRVCLRNAFSVQYSFSR